MKIPTITPKQRLVVFRFTLLALLVLSIGIGTWNTFEIRRIDKMSDDSVQNFAEAIDDTEQRKYNSWSTHVVSGKANFELNLPDGWGPVLNIQDSDYLVMLGTQQPTLTSGAETTIESIEGYGGDSPVLFSVMTTSESTYINPSATVSDFTLTNGKENSIEGKKYTYIFDEDKLEGIGYQRYKGDRNYTYKFSLPNGLYLVINYSVYGADPRNQADTVEAIIDTIRIPASAM